MQASTPAAAEGEDLGDLFEYKLESTAVDDSQKNQSAMVPILQSEIRAEKISVWTLGRSGAHPLRGVWLSNTSGETLDGGNFSVIEDEIFAGQGLLDPIKPDERRLLSYATDLGMTVREAGLNAPQRNIRVAIAHGTMIRTSEVREKKTYTMTATTILRSALSLLSIRSAPDGISPRTYSGRRRLPWERTASA